MAPGQSGGFGYVHYSEGKSLGSFSIHSASASGKSDGSQQGASMHSDCSGEVSESAPTAVPGSSHSSKMTTCDGSVAAYQCCTGSSSSVYC